MELGIEIMTPPIIPTMPTVNPPCLPWVPSSPGSFQNDTRERRVAVFLRLWICLCCLSYVLQANKIIRFYSLKHSVILKNVIKNIDEIEEVVSAWLPLWGFYFTPVICWAVIIVEITALCEDRVFEIQVAFQKQLFPLPGNAPKYQGQKPFRWS